MESDNFGHLSEFSKHTANLAYRRIVLLMERGYTFAKAQDVVFQTWCMSNEEESLTKAYCKDLG